MMHDGLWRARGDRGAVPIATLVIALAVAGGLVVGSILGFTGALDFLGESDTVAAATPAPYYECPGDSSSSGALHRGDRVLATGRTEGPSFVQVRSPRSSDARVWIAVEYLEPDADLQALPILPCAVVVEVTVETTIPGDTTTTSFGETTTTVVDTTTSSTTTTTLPPPSVGQISESEDPIWESYDDADTCIVFVGDFPSTSVISAPITAPAGVQTVTMSWSVGGISGSTAMSLSSGQYRATLGPFDAVDPNVVTAEPLPITVTVTVTDSLGRQANRQTTVTLNDCNFF